MNMIINVAKDYSPFVLGRYSTDSDYNGEEFRKKYLLPALKSLNKNSNDKVTIDFEGTYGCDPSFLEEAFGGTIRSLKEQGIDPLGLLWERVTISTPDQAENAAIQGYIKDALNA